MYLKFYLASPLGFAESTRSFMDDLIDSLSQTIDVVNPWDEQRFEELLINATAIPDYDDRAAAFHQINLEIGESNVDKIEQCDGVIAILDGVDVDSGTASEIGFASARGKLVHGLRTDFRLASDNIGSIVNLQVEYFIKTSGGQIYTKVDDLMFAISKLN
jgi:nucleoside 2-deoxyribosyltransferase